MSPPEKTGSRQLWISSLILFFFSFRLASACPMQISQSSACASTARAAIVKKVGVSREPEALAVEIEIGAAVVPASDRITNPDRLVFDFAGCELEGGGGRRIPVNSGSVQALRVSQYSVNPPVMRVVVDSIEPLDFQVKPAGNRIVIEIPFPNPGVSADATHHAPAAEGKAARSGPSTCERT